MIVDTKNRLALQPMNTLKMLVTAAALLAGNGCALTSDPVEPGRPLSAQDSGRLEQARQQALETMPSGRGISWSNRNADTSGSITPIRTYRLHATGQFCREFEETLNTQGQLLQRTRLACRTDTGYWELQDV